MINIDIKPNKFWGGFISGIIAVSLIITLLVNVILFLERKAVDKHDVRIVEQHDK